MLVQQNWGGGGGGGGGGKLQNRTVVYARGFQTKDLNRVNRIWGRVSLLLVLQFRGGES